MLGRELGGRRDLDRLELTQRALGEGREVAQRLDLDVEQVGPHRVVLGCGEDVDDPAADRELAAVVDLLDALVARVDQRHRELVEIDQVALGDRERARPQRRVGHLLAEGDRGHDDDRRLLGGLRRVRIPARQRLERGDAQADEMRRRREVRLVGHAAARREPHRARVQPRAQVGGEVLGLAVVPGDDDRRAPRGERVVDPVEQRRDEVGPQRQRDERAAALAREPDAVRGVGELAKERAQRHVEARRTAAQMRGRALRPTIATRRGQAAASMLRRT